MRGRGPGVAGRLLVSAVVVGLALAACGDDAGEAVGTDDPAETTTSTDADAGPPEDEPNLPVEVVDDTGARVTVSSVERIVPLDGDIAEVVFALGLGDRVVATDLSATYPPEADDLPEIGYQRSLTPEPIAAVEPTVALASDLAGPTETLDALRGLGIPLVVLHQEDGPTGPPTKIRRVAEALGVPGRGEALARQVEEGITEHSTEPGDDAPTVAALYLRGDAVQMVLGAGSGIDWVIAASGGVDVGTELGIEDSAPLSTEALVAADPDLFVVSTTGLESVGGLDGFLSLPGIAETAAGRSRNVFARPDQFLFGNGPRTPDLISALSAAVSGEPGPRVEDDGAPRTGGSDDGSTSFDDDERAVVDAWATVFDSRVGLGAKAHHLEDADGLADTVASYSESSEQYGGIHLRPTAVEIDGTTTTVTYDVLFGDDVTYSGLTGHLDLVDGTWTVSREEFCSFMAAARNACPS